MPENKYIRQASIEILELVPMRDNLPECSAWLTDGTQCPYKAKYEVNGNPTCGHHVRATMFMPARLRRKATG